MRLWVSGMLLLGHAIHLAVYLFLWTHSVADSSSLYCFITHMYTQGMQGIAQTGSSLNDSWPQWVYVVAGMLQEGGLSVDYYHTTEIAQQRLHNRDCTTEIAQQRLHNRDCTTKIMQQRYELEGRIPGDSPRLPHFSSSSSGRFSPWDGKDPVRNATVTVLLVT